MTAKLTGSVRTALIVEDEPPIRSLLRLHLTSAGFQVEECGDGSTAARRLREQGSPRDARTLSW